MHSCEDHTTHKSVFVINDSELYTEDNCNNQGHLVKLFKELHIVLKEPHHVTTHIPNYSKDNSKK